jgi:hypothetical protein
MGCDIHTVVQRKTEQGRWEEISFAPFDWRSYGMFGFLANVRNYSAVPSISEPRGLPDDLPAYWSEEHDVGDHSFSWLSVEELLAFDYDAPFEDRRVTRQVGPNAFDGGVTGHPGEGETTTFRAFLGPDFFRDLNALKALGATRVVFWFDS